MVTDAEMDFSRRFVLYWMCTAVRCDENPALDLATAIATQRGLPLLVYHALSETYQYASDRHHTFIMEGARDVQLGFAERGISYAFHLEREGQRELYLRQLVRQAAVVVTEDMPTGPQLRFLRALGRRSSTCIIAADTACVVPMQCVGRAFDRAFQFRSATEQLYAERLTRAWPSAEPQPQPLDPAELPFDPVDLQSSDIAEMVAACNIDHAVGPVVDTCGGSRAGYARWKAFCDSGLKSYAKNRNDPLRDGVSRMSAYLHYGMVSPLRLAREAADWQHDGARKFLDELLIWRELAYAFCFYRADHATWNAIPDWARETLTRHASDRRSQLFSWEQLARGQTGDALWDAAQHSLLIHGELHNNVRMTWGKALLQWTRTPQAALDMLIDLNHRYALDGRDPASYGGILWCLGQFDRPFEPSQPVIGTVRPRPLQQHARRLDVAAYGRRILASRSEPVPKVAVIGAGISGCMAARTLADHGLPVTVFEKSRGAGGRMATRRTPHGDFDHGAQYFTVRDANLQRYVASWVEQGLVQPWKGRIAVLQADEPPQEASAKSQATERFVGVPGMNAICKHLIEDLQLNTEVTIASVQTVATGYQLLDEHGVAYGPFDRVIVTAPAKQSSAILNEYAELSAEIAKVRLQPCWAVLIALSDKLSLDWNAAFVNDSPVSWIARNTTKPSHAPVAGEALTVHASAEWSAAHVEDTPEQVLEVLMPAIQQHVPFTAADVLFVQTHRWRYAIPANPSSRRCLTNRDGTLLAGGDWAGGPRVEGAFLSGTAAAGRILSSLPRPAKTPTFRQPSLF
jgi:photolyase PhrII